MSEVFLKHRNFEGLEFSNLGRVKKGNKIYTPYTSKNSGYQRLTYNYKPYLFHRIIAELFCKKECESKNIVDHINGLRDDNRAVNLRWVNHSENNKNRRNDGVKTKIELEHKKGTHRECSKELYYKEMMEYYKKEYEKKCNAYNVLFEEYNETQKFYLNSISNRIKN